MFTLPAELLALIARELPLLFRPRCREVCAEWALWLGAPAVWTDFSEGERALYLCRACACGGLLSVEWLSLAAPPKEIEIAQKCLLSACLDGRQEVAQLLVEKFALAVRVSPSAPEGMEPASEIGVWALHSACKGGHLLLVQWIIEAFGLEAEDIRDYEDHAMDVSSAQGHLHVALWLEANYFENEAITWPFHEDPRVAG